MIAAAARSYLLACLRDSPGLLVAEDLHWFDASTRERVGSMLDACAGRLLVVLTSRDGAALPWQVERSELAPLTHDETDELVGALDPTVGDEQRAEVRRRCDGVPFHIEQVVAGLHITSADSPHVPDALYEPLFARLRAGKDAVLVVEAAAVIGRNIERALLRAVVDLDAGEVDEVIDQLTDAHVLEPWGGDSRRFRHELLREVAASRTAQRAAGLTFEGRRRAGRHCDRRSGLATDRCTLRAGCTTCRRRHRVPAGVGRRS